MAQQSFPIGPRQSLPFSNFRLSLSLILITVSLPKVCLIAVKKLVFAYESDAILVLPKPSSHQLQASVNILYDFIEVCCSFVSIPSTDLEMVALEFRRRCFIIEKSECHDGSSCVDLDR